MKKLSIALFLWIFISGAAQAIPIYDYYPNSHSPTPATQPGNLTARGGVDVGNGGFAYKCPGQTGYHSYDLDLAQLESAYSFPLRPVKNAKESLKRIGDLIAVKLPTLKPSFDEFMKQLFLDIPSNKYQWLIEVPSPEKSLGSAPYDSFDTDVASRLCHESFDIFMDDFYGSQVILRVSGGDDSKVYFLWSIGRYYSLPELDQSFLVVHEWLWNFTDNPKDNREANLLLHSKWLETATPKQAKKAFKELLEIQ